ncbi:MAG: glycerate kinase [Ignavibacteria bacterium]|jgi:hydroxypyruvate reductase/glycerate 2-kinase
MKSKLKELFLAGIERVKPQNLFDNCLSLNNNLLMIKNSHDEKKVFDLNLFENIFIIGAGKASAEMASVIEKIFGEYNLTGSVLTKYGFTSPTGKINILEAGHPVPDENGINGAQKIIEVLNSATEKDLIINLLSGGASSLLVSPVDEISLEDKRKISDLMINCGADITEINTVRKKFSNVKGGKLLNYAYPATVISFIISDVAGDNLEFIGSGPTVNDTSTYKDAYKIISKYELIDNLPSNAVKYLEDRLNGMGPKSESNADIFKKTHNILLGNNKLALEAVKEKALQAGLMPQIVNYNLTGDVHFAAEEILYDIEKNINEKKCNCLIYGGETTVNVKGNGKGGRNQEFALILAEKIKDKNNVYFLSGGTDGNDGNTEAAGAIADGATIQRAKNKKLDYQKYLFNNDSYSFFKELDDLIITGPTKSNVMDIQIVLID